MIKTVIDRKKLGAALALGLLFAAAPALAQEDSDDDGKGKPPPVAAEAATRASWQADTDAYCHYIVGAANAESDLLIAPRVFGTFGVVNGADAAGVATALPPVKRLTVGGSYSISDLFQGVTIRQRAEADCQRQRTISRLRAFTVANEDGKSAVAAKAKLKVLEAALPRATQILASVKAAMAQNHATLDELNATELRVDALRTSLRDARAEVEGNDMLPSPPNAAVPELIHAHGEAEEKVERYDARLREAKGWDITLRGGYDQVFGVRDYVPLFGTVTVSISLGLLFAPFSDSDAISGKRSFASAEIHGVDDRARTVARRLRATRCSEESRLKEAGTLLADVLSRQKAVDAIGGDKTKPLSDYLFFERARLESEVEYLKAHLAELRQSLGQSDC